MQPIAKSGETAEHMDALHQFRVDKLNVEVYDERHSMAQAASTAIAEAFRATIKAKGHARAIFAAAPSQAEILDLLREQHDVAWDKVTAFHMDDYLELPPDAPQRFANWLTVRLFEPLPFAAVHCIPASGGETEICTEYEQLLRAEAIDILCLGIGVNAHIAFNDPPVADFDETPWVKVVELDDICRQQQVDDACFPTLDDVPRRAVTLTIPCLMASKQAFCVVPGTRKREAVRGTLYGPISTKCPASILRTHPSCTMFLNHEAFPDA